MSGPLLGSEFESAERLFLAWIEEVEGGRGGTFEALCAAHPTLAPRLEEIAAFHERARELLEGGAAEEDGTIDGTRYELRGEIARGGMGTILLAYDPELSRTIAVKVLRARAESPAELERRRRRLVGEARVLAQLDHPGIVPIYEAGRDAGGSPYFTMKKVDGEDFLAVLRAHHAGDERWRLPRAIGVLRSVCEAVAYAHERGAIHRDLKPQNVMVGRFGEVFVMDWGLAKVLGGASEDAPEIVGTPAYMPPEQATTPTEALDARVDVYAIGAMLYHLLSGGAPHADAEAPGAGGMLASLLRGAPRPLARAAPGAPEELVAVCEKAMARDPAARYASAIDLAADLEAWLEGRVVRAHRTGAWVELVKWIGRNRGAAAAIAALVLGISAVALVETLLSRELAQRNEALRREDTYSRLALASAEFANGDIGHMRELLAGCPEDLRGWEWRYLDREADTSRRMLQAPGVDLKSALLLDERTLVAAGQGDRAWIGVYDLDDGSLAREIRLAEGRSINNVSLSADGSILAAFGHLGELSLWDTRAWTLRSVLDARLHGWHGAAFAPAGAELAAYGTEGVQLWDAETGAFRVELSAGQKDVADVAWSPDGRRLAAASWDGSVSVWDVASAELVEVLRASAQRMQQVEWSPDGRWIAGGDWDSRVHVWDAGTLEAVHRSDRLGGHVQALAWSPDSAWLVVGGRNVVVRVLEAGTWEPVGRLVGHTAPVQSLAFSADGATLISACALGEVHLWDLGARGWRTQHRGAGREPPAGVAFSPDGRRAAIGWGNGAVEVWDVERRERARLLEAGSGIRHVDWSPGAPAIAAARWDCDVVLLDPEGAAPPRSLAVAEPTEVHFDPTGTILAATAQDGTLRAWYAGSGALLWEASTPVESAGWPGNLFGASWSPRGDEIVASTHAGLVQVRSARDGSLLRETRRPGMLFSQFCREGRHVLVWAYGADQGMELLDARTLEPLWTSTRTNHMWPVLAPDCERVFSANWQGFLGIWDAGTGRLVAEIPGLPPGNPRLDVAPDGGCVILAAGNRIAFFDTRAEH